MSVSTEPEHSFDDKYPRVHLLYRHPTPIERLANLEEHLKDATEQKTIPTLWVSREDGNSGLGGGGNKIRKLEYVLHDAKAKRATVLVTTGGQQSNHMRQVAAAAAKMRMKTYLVPKNALHHDTADSEVYNHGANVQITDLLSASRHDVQDSPENVEAASEEVMNKLRSAGEVPYWIPSGASTHSLGGLGYARFALELAQQDQEVDTIFVASNSGSTLGGLIAGFKLIAQRRSSSGYRPPRLIGVDTFSGRVGGAQAKHVLGIAQNTAKLIGVQDPEITISEKDFEIDERFSGEAYGKLDEPVRDAVKTLATTEGILLDPVYTGKAFAALLHSVRTGEHREGGKGPRANWLFIHTGGTPILGAYPDLR